MATKKGEEFKKEEEKSNRISKKVLFVRNLPYDIKDGDFEKAFSDIGPIRRSYLIKEKGSSNCRGFGYVTFAIEEDAQRAMETVKMLGGRKLKFAFSDKKPRQNRQEKHPNKEKKLQGSEHEESHHDDDDDDDENDNTVSSETKKDRKNFKKKEEEEEEEEEEKETKHKSTTKPDSLPSSESKTRKPKSQRAQPQSDIGRTVHLFGLPSTISAKEIYKRCRKVGEIENTAFPLEERDEPVAALTFKTPKDARIAVAKLNNKVIKGKEVTAVLKSKEHQQLSQKSLKKSRLIVRNLSFKCTDAILKEFFSQYGKINEVNMPVTMKGRRKKKQGFAFVQFSDVFSAAKAREAMNLKEIFGRPIAVDWAIPKDQYEKVGKSLQGNKDEKVEGEANQHDDDEQHSENDDDDENNDDNESHEEDERLEESGQESDDADDDDKNDQEEDDDDEDSQENKKKPSDVKEGLTVFISNLNYDTTQKSLFQLFKKYGDIEYCKIVTDPLTDHSKGTAFVKFKAVESVENCLEEANVEGVENEGLHLDGFNLRVHLAVTRGKAQQLRMENKESKKEPRDKRNLYLAREGVVTAGSEAAKDLSKADLQKREKAETEKKAKLRNPNYFVSTTRLCVRNLPLSVTEKELEKIFSTSGAVNGGKPALVKKVMIMRSKDRMDGSGKGRSLGFGFIEFSSHKEALTALRQTNNNPETFGSNRRPIVEFSIENSLALKAKQQRMTRSKNKEKPRVEEEEVIKTNKQRRIEKGVRRREKRKLKRLNKKSAGDKDASSVAEGNTNSLANRPNSVENFKKKKKLFPSKKQQKSLKKEPVNLPTKDTKSVKLFQRATKSPQKEPANQSYSSRKNSKRKATDMKEEAAFNAIVQKYKSKLFGDSNSAAKRSRWFE